jgi:hypothetical protein
MADGGFMEHGGNVIKPISIDELKKIEGSFQSYSKGVMAGKRDEGYVTIRDEEDLMIYLTQKLGNVVKNISVKEIGKDYPDNMSNPYFYDTYAVELIDGTKFDVERKYGIPNWGGNVDYIEEIKIKNKMAKGGVVYTDLKDIPNLMDRVERGYVTYRGLGAFKEGTEITVDGKKYIVTDDDFNSIARDKDGNMRIRFSAPSRKRYEDGGYMEHGGEITYAVVDENTDRIYIRSNNENFIKLKYNELKEIYPQDKLRIIKFEKGKYMAKGGIIRNGDELTHYEPYFEKNVRVASIDEDEKIIRPSMGYFYPNKIAKKTILWAKNNGYKFIQDGKEYAKGGYMEHGGVVGEKFTISSMREKLGSMFPDSFGFTVGTISTEGNKSVNSSALITNPNDPFRGLKDEDINSKLFFPQYKKLHDIRFRIYQGGENTYFYFNLESTDGDEYVGQFGFKDEGDVPSSYITRFIAFLMEQYGLPFEVNHSVMAKGGMTDHNLMVGDKIRQGFDNMIEVENDGKTYLVNINTGQRWTLREWMSLNGVEMEKYTKMAKGGELSKGDKITIFGEEYEFVRYETDKSQGYDEERVLLKSKDKSGFSEYQILSYPRDMVESYSNYKMAKGGVVYTDLNDIPNLMDRVERGYVTYRGLGAFKEGTEITVDGKKYIVTDDDFNSIARDKDGNMRIRFSAPSRKRYEDGGYMAMGGTIKKGDRVRSTVFKDEEGEVINKKGDMLFVRKEVNGQSQHDVFRVNEVEKLAMGGELTKVDVKLFKKGDKIKISYGSSISRNSEVTLMVKNITLVNKGKSNEKEKITFINLDNPTGVKYYAYISTNSDYVGFAIGDMAISNVKLINKFEDGGSLGDSKYLARMAEEYAEREYEKPVKKGNSTALAGKLPNGKLYYKEITVYFKDGTTHTFMQEDFEEFFDVDDYAKGGELQKGIRVEMKEHGMSRAKATKTALDHLKENPKYYTKMEEAGLESGGEVEFFDYSNADLDKLPVGLTKYFNKPKGTITIEMSKIVPTRAREKGVKNANKYMLQAYKGEIEKRDPIKVYKQKGKYYVQDGNSTYANAKFSGWKTIYATVVKNPKLVEVSKNRQGNVLSLAKEIRQVGESWQDAIQRAKKMNK